jgi:hypothetical protein
MVGGLVVVDLMNGDCGVDDVGLDGLLLDDGLDGLVDVVVDVLAANRGSDILARCGSLNAPLVLELGLLLHKAPLDGVVVAVVELAMLDSTELSSVCLRKNLAVLDGLDSAVVVVLVNLLVYRGVNLLMLVRLNRLVGDRWCNGLMDCGVMVTGTAGEVGEGCLDFVHGGELWCVVVRVMELLISVW